MTAHRREILKSYCALVATYAQNQEIIANLTNKVFLDPGEQTILELFQKLQVEIQKNIGNHCKVLSIENPYFNDKVN